MRINPSLILATLALGLGAGCGSVSSTNDGGGGAGGGAAGQGGATGQAGHGGATGQGGTAGSSTCGDLSAEYAAALPAAQRCEIGASDQCMKLVSGSLSPCFVNCMTYANDDSALNSIKQSWVQAGCNNVAVLCPAIACLQPTNNMCVAGDGGAGASSSSNVGLPTN